MATYSVILFDLDGTLTDPKLGITKSVQYALDKLGIKLPDLEQLVPFIGPPLEASFADYFGFDERTCELAIAYYREYFSKVGIFENTVFEGVQPLLADLVTQERTVVLATSKPTEYVQRILSHFALDSYFHVVAGSNLDNTRTDKGEVIQYALAQLTNAVKSQCVMVGDRKHDIIGARVAGIDSIGVTFGYGSEDELRHANPTHLVKDIQSLRKLLMV